MTRRAHAAATAVLAAAIVLVHPVAPARAAATAGPAQIVTAGNGTAASRHVLTTGSDDTAFSLALPEGAACTGDSAHDEYRVQSFMVRDGVDPATLTFGELGPEPTALGSAFRQALYLQNTDAYVNAPTNVAAKPGGPGVVINIPVFTLRGFSAAELPPAKYVVGVACTKGGPSDEQLDRYWATTLDLTATAAPGGGAKRTWTAPVELSPKSATGHRAAETRGVFVASSAATAAAARPTAAHHEAPIADVPPGGEPSFGIPAIAIPLGAPWAVALWRFLRVFVPIALMARCTQLLLRKPRPVPPEVVSPT